MAWLIGGKQYWKVQPWSRSTTRAPFPTRKSSVSHRILLTSSVSKVVGLDYNSGRPTSRVSVYSYFRPHRVDSLGGPAVTWVREWTAACVRYVPKAAYTLTPPGCRFVSLMNADTGAYLGAVTSSRPSQ